MKFVEKPCGNEAGCYRSRCQSLQGAREVRERASPGSHLHKDVEIVSRWYQLAEAHLDNVLL